MTDEYIKRHDAEMAIEDIYSPYGEDGSGDAISREVAMSKIREIHAADVRPVVHARWEYDRKEDCAICSNCNDEIYLGTYHQFSNNYCPNCGADMREVDNED